MVRWWWWPRSAPAPPAPDLTSLLIRLQAAAAAGEFPATDPAQASAVQAVARMTALAFASATVTGLPAPVTLPPGWMAQNGYAATVAGEFFGAPERVGDRLRFTPAAVEEVRPNGDYRLRMPTPDGAERLITDPAPLAVLYNPITVWRGAPPWADVAAAAALAGLEAAIAAEARTPNARLLSSSWDDVGEAQAHVDAMLDRINRASGTVERLSTQTSRSPRLHVANDVATPPAGREGMLTRVGFEGSNPQPQLLAELRASVMVSLGVPPALTSPTSSSAGIRESYRAWIAASVEPQLAILQAALRAHLGADVTIEPAGLRAADVGARARAVAQLVGTAGMELDDALDRVGL